MQEDLTKEVPARRERVASLVLGGQAERFSQENRRRYEILSRDDVSIRINHICERLYSSFLAVLFP
jgi:hypothetical protein